VISFFHCTAWAGNRLEAVAASFERLTGRRLAEGDGAWALWSAPRAIVAHGTEPDPVFFYANRLALELFELTGPAFTRLPSRLSAEPVARAERAHAMARVAAQGFIDDYAGVRVSAAGRRFRIEQAVVWNADDGEGRRVGQAATFERWTRLD
jgi:hypothetical protein